MTTPLKRVFLPALIPPKKHRILDYITAAAFLTVAGIWWRNHRKPAIAALAHGVFVLTYTPLTDFEGSGSHPISFQKHGTLDRIQAGLASLAPEMLGFAAEKEAWFFRGQSLNEDLVIALTDYDTQPVAERLSHKAA
jgi:hypothetical protein